MMVFGFHMLNFLQFLICGTLTSGQEPDDTGFGDCIKLGEIFINGFAGALEAVKNRMVLVLLYLDYLTIYYIITYIIYISVCLVV